jgi:hypothetical protein
VGVGPFAHWASKSCAAINIGLSILSSCWVTLLGLRPLLYARETESVEAGVQVSFVLQLDVVETDGAIHAAVTTGSVEHVTINRILELRVCEPWSYVTFEDMKTYRKLDLPAVLQ